MTAGQMHADEVLVDVATIRRLLLRQFPQWAGLPVTPVRSSGTDNTIYRLGEELSVRLPRVERVTGQVEKEHRWLPVLAPHLPLRIPVPLAMGMPGEGYPWQWSVYPWLAGQDAAGAPIADLQHAATQLAQFITALQGVDSAGGPAPGLHNFGRGVALERRDARTRAAIDLLPHDIDVAALTVAWDRSLSVPVHGGPPVWIHGDLSPGNLLVERGRITGVLDFGGLAVGDPACDLIVAWNLLSADSRHVFRNALRIDDATWERGRGWALSVAVIALAYYQHTNPVMVGESRRTIREVLADR